MKTSSLILALLFLSTAGVAMAQPTAFTYQGRLADNGVPTAGNYDLRFTIYDSLSGGLAQSAGLDTPDVPVTNGLFTVTLDFGEAVFNGAARWLDIAVRPGTSTGIYTNLAPRQPITAAPYAIRAANLTGALPLSQLPPGVVTNNSSSLNLTGTFSGNGGALTNVNATTLGGVSGAGFWKTTGNSGANPINGAFLGTTDNQPLELKVNGSRVLRLVPDLTSPNLLAGSPANDTVGGIRGASVLGGGNASYPNRVAADYATVVGGVSNTASGNASVAMGQFSTASGYGAFASGYGTTAGGFSSFAAGNSARAAHDGSFVWGDNTFADFASTANNQFLIRAAGGVGINNNNPNGAALAVNGDMTVSGNFKGGNPGNIISNGVTGGFIGGGGYQLAPHIVGEDHASVVRLR